MALKLTTRKWTHAKTGEQREAWRVDYVDHAGVRRREQFKRKRDAEARLRELDRQMSAGTFRPDAKVTTVEAACDLYLSDLEKRLGRGEVTETYYRTNVAQLYNFVAPRDRGEHKGRAKLFAGGIGTIKLSALTAKSVGDFRDRMRDDGVSVVTARRVLGALSRVLSYAVEQELVATNVAQGVRVKGRRDEGSERIVPPSKAALAAILAAADADFAVKVRFAAVSGLRASELHALQWENVDLEAGLVTVSSRVDAFGSIDTTKSDAGRRSVPIGAAMVKEMKEWRARSKHAKDSDFVFPNSTGGFVRHTNMTKRDWNPLLTKAGVEPFGWHSLRHFAVSKWIEAGLQPKTVQTYAGHATYAITMNRYGHMFPTEAHRDAMDRVAADIF